MATTDQYCVVGDLTVTKNAIRCLGGNSDDYLQVNAHAVARVAANDSTGTYSAWVMVPDNAATYTILGAGDDNVVEFLELSIESGLLTCRITDATTAQLVTQADAVHFKPHKWHHVAVVQGANGYGPKLYVDGSQVAATNDTATDVDSWYAELDGIDTFRIGAANKVGDASVTQEFAGFIGRVKYWNRALTADEVDKDYHNQTFSDDSTYLQLDMDMDTLEDAGLGADDGTIVGATIKAQANEFFSRLTFSTGVAVVADKVLMTADGGKGYALVIQAA